MAQLRLHAMNRVELATEADIPLWLALAAQVGALFGADMATDTAFRELLARNVRRGSAFCVRSNGELAGAMLFRAPWIRWLAVRRDFRRRGVGRALVAHSRSTSTAEVRVVTFAADHPHLDARAALALYRAMNFLEIGGAAPGADGTPRVAMAWRRARASGEAGA